MSATVKFPQYAPDITNLGTGVSGTIQNVVPRVDGYGPFQALIPFTKNLPARCRGYFFARRSDSSIAMFAGTATDLYLLSNIDFTWTLVSKGGVPYSGLLSGANWQFVQFNDTVLAAQVNTVPQAFGLASSTAFADLGGSPPQAGCIAVVNFFVVLTELLSNPRRVQWSDLSGITTWTPGVGLSDFQDLPDGGGVHGISGGDAYGCIFQDSCIRSLIYAPGSPVVFQIVRIAQDDGLFAKYSIINSGTKTFFNSPQGFKVIEAGGAPRQIGKGRVDDFFKNDVDQSALQLVIGATDPTQTRVYFAYKSKSGTAGLFDKILCYDWSISDNGQWSLILQSGEYLASLARPGLTLENLDAIAPTPLNVLNVTNNGSGIARLTLDAIANANFQIAGQNFIVVQGVTGTGGLANQVNGQKVPIIIDATHIDLAGIPFVGVYTGGGQIGGSLDALNFSLDDVSSAATTQLSAMTTQHAAGFFTGPNLEAIIETDEQDSQGTLIFINGMMPMTDCAAALCSVGGRMTAQQAAPTYSPESAVNPDGNCPMLVETRYAKARLRCPAGASWTYARGIQPDVMAAGDS